MLQLLLLALAGTAASLRPRGSEDPSPTTDPWAPATFQVPHPYGTPSVYYESTGASGCLAHLKVRSTRSCVVQSTWVSTTTVGVGIDCRGCSDLNVSILRGNCPLGGHHSNPVPTTISSTPYTAFEFQCAPTAGATAVGSQARTTDLVKALPVPTLAASQSPPYTPVALSAVYWPDGGCYAAVTVAPTASSQAAKECQEASSTKYTSTVTSRIGIDCGGCRVLQTIGDTHSCPAMISGAVDHRTNATEPATQWFYECN